LVISSYSRDGGLIGYWPFEGTAEDKSINGNDGKIVMPAVSMDFSPDERLFYSVRDAKETRIMKPDLTEIEEPFVRLKDNSTDSTQEVLGIKLDPQFASNHYVYAYVTAKDNDTGDNFNRLIRFTELENRAIKQEILLDNISSEGKGQFEGALAFGPDDNLYVTTGYINQIGDQNINSSTGKILRIKRDGTIPADNPISNSPVYTVGHRNIFGMAFDKTTGIGIVAENDASDHDEINVLKSGADYDYSVKRLPQSSSTVKASQSDNSSAMEPVRTYYKIITPTQMIFYDNNRFRDLKGTFLVASYDEKSLYALSFNQTGSLVKEVAIRLPEVRGHIISIAEAPNGEIYVAGESINKLVSIDSNGALIILH
jgi:glucose/arabinose dehydrogenase